jgi:hypothetical protein
LKKKIRKAKLEPEELNQHFEILCNVLRFTTKRHIVRHTSEPDDKKEKEKQDKHDPSESNLPSSMLKDAGTQNHSQNCMSN